MSTNGQTASASATGLSKPDASDTSDDAAAVQRRVFARMTGLERIRAQGRLFTALHRLLAMRFDDPVDVLHHLHGNSLDEADYQAIARLIRKP